MFIVLSLAAASMLPINRIIEVKSCTYPPGLRDPALRGNRLALSIIIPFIRVSIINFNHGEEISKQNKRR